MPSPPGGSEGSLSPHISGPQNQTSPTPHPPGCAQGQPADRWAQAHDPPAPKGPGPRACRPLTNPPLLPTLRPARPRGGTCGRQPGTRSLPTETPGRGAPLRSASAPAPGTLATLPLHGGASTCLPAGAAGRPPALASLTLGGAAGHQQAGGAALQPLGRHGFGRGRGGLRVREVYVRVRARSGIAGHVSRRFAAGPMRRQAHAPCLLPPGPAPQRASGAESAPCDCALGPRPLQLRERGGGRPGAQTLAPERGLTSRRDPSAALSTPLARPLDTVRNTVPPSSLGAGT